MQRWMISLRGNRADLQLLAETLGSLHSFRIEQVDEDYYLTSTEVPEFDFDGLRDGAVVHELRERAERIVSIIRGFATAYALLEADFGLGGRIVTIGDDGTQKAVVSIDTTRVLRVESHENRAQFAADVALALAKGGAVETVARLFDRLPSWSELYKIFELIEDDMGGIPPSWATTRETAAFCSSANHAAISGLAARHSVNPGAPPGPRRVMDYATAHELVARLTRHWLEHRRGGASEA